MSSLCACMWVANNSRSPASAIAFIKTTANEDRYGGQAGAKRLNTFERPVIKRIFCNLSRIMGVQETIHIIILNIINHEF